MVGLLSSSLKRWFPPSALVVLLVGGIAAAQRIGVPWQSWMAGLLCLTGLLLACIVTVMTLDVLLRLSSSCYQEWIHGSRRGPRHVVRVLGVVRRAPKSSPNIPATEQAPAPARSYWPYDKFSSHVG
jgi:hypothetical protein